MTTSSSAGQARQALADRLRDLRLDAGLTAKQLAVQAGWHRTKVSKLEHAVTAPSADDITTWCTLCQAADQIGDLLASMRAADSTWTQWRRLERAGLKRAQETVLPLWEATRRFRFYSSWLVPGPVQSEPYIRALLQEVASYRPGALDVDEAVAVRVAKQDLIHQAGRTFAIVLEENVLHHQVGGPATLAAQLRHLLAVMSLPSISVGIIPLSADRGSISTPVEMFLMFDDAQVNVELVSGWLRVTQPGEIAMYADAFTRLSSMAVVGQAARELVTSALAVLDG